MRIFFTFLISIFFLTNLYGQVDNKISEISYTFYIDTGKSTVTTDCSLIFVHNLRESTFINFGFAEVPRDNTISKTGLDGSQFTETEKFDDNNGQKPEYQKKFKTNSLSSFETVYGEKKYLIIEETIPKLNWEVKNETKSLLNVKVQKAIVSFRGRDYEAWFAPSIRIPDGPYKFNGLPGLILQIGSKDGKFKFEAYALNLNQNSRNFTIKTLQEKYKDREILTLEQKLILARKNEEKEIKYQLSKNPGIQNYKIESTGIETEFPKYEK